jgi:hypothetical protein
LLRPIRGRLPETGKSPRIARASFSNATSTSFWRISGDSSMETLVLIMSESPHLHRRPLQEKHPRSQS